MEARTNSIRTKNTGGEPRACATALVLIAVLVTANTAAARLTVRASGASGIQ